MMDASNLKSNHGFSWNSDNLFKQLFLANSSYLEGIHRAQSIFQPNAAPGIPSFVDLP